MLRKLLICLCGWRREGRERQRESEREKREKRENKGSDKTKELGRDQIIQKKSEYYSEIRGSH